MGALNVTQRRSRNGANKKQIDTLRSLGLRRIGHTVQLQDSEQTRGMLHAVRHLIEVEEGKKATQKPAGEEGRKATKKPAGEEGRKAMQKPAGQEGKKATQSPAGQRRREVAVGSRTATARRTGGGDDER